MTPDSSGKLKRGQLSKNAEHALDSASKSLLQASPLACVVLDQARTIQSWSAGAEALLGWLAMEVHDQPFFRLLSNATAENQLGSNDGNPTEHCLRKKNGETVEVQIASSKLPVGASIESGYILLLQDISEKRFLEQALLEASEREQRRIGQELHDHLCQHLVGAAFAAKAMAAALERDQSFHAPQLHDLARLINDAVTQVRDISRGLHPVELDAGGLMSALQELANRAGQMTPCIFHCKGHVLVKNTAAALNAYRIAQESVTAVLQKTGARSIRISLSQSGKSIHLEIADDGREESELTANPQGIAVKTLQYRAQAMHGSLTLEFIPKEGTRVTCLFPA